MTRAFFTCCSLLALGAACTGGRGADEPDAPDAATVADAAGDRGAPAADTRTGDAPVADSAPALTADEFVARYCALLAPCCPRVGKPADGATCRTLVAAQASQTFRPATAEACLGVLAAAPDLCQAGFAGAWSCQRVFTDVVASKHLGESCTVNEDCLVTQPNVSCARVGPGPGRCQAKVRGQEGDMPCAGTVDRRLTVPSTTLTTAPAKVFLCDLADNVWCDDDTHLCTRTRTVGAACDRFGQCGAPNRCDDQTGKCAPRLADGMKCDVDEACLSGYCREDNVCATPPAIEPRLAPLCGS